MKKNIQLLIITLAFISGAASCKQNNTGTNPVEPTVMVKATKPVADFEQSVYKVLEAFKEENQAALDSLTNSNEGIMVLYRTGVFNEYKNITKIEFKMTDPVRGFPYNALRSGYRLKYESLPKFNCGTMEWDKHGLYCDTIKKDTLLSGTPENLIKYRGDKIPMPEIKRLKNLEAKSRRIVLAHQNEDLIFYMTLIDNRWYLTAIDRITTDCSA